MKHSNVQVSAGAYFCAAVAVLLIPVNWLAGWLTAVAVHEAGHLATLRWMKVPIHQIEFCLSGAKISAGPMTPAQEMVCAAAGPLCSFLLLIAAPRFPAAALIGLVQGLFNLLPFYPLDGGRVLRSGLNLLREMHYKRKIPCKDGRLRVQ